MNTQPAAACLTGLEAGLDVCCSSEWEAEAAAVPGRPGCRGQTAVEAARVEIERLRATLCEQAVALHLHEGKARWD